MLELLGPANSKCHGYFVFLVFCFCFVFNFNSCFLVHCAVNGWNTIKCKPNHPCESMISPSFLVIQFYYCVLSVVSYFHLWTTVIFENSFKCLGLMRYKELLSGTCWHSIVGRWHDGNCVSDEGTSERSCSFAPIWES